MKTITDSATRQRIIVESDIEPFQCYGVTDATIEAGGPALEAIIQKEAEELHYGFSDNDEYPSQEGFEVADYAQYLRNHVAARKLIIQAVKAWSTDLERIIHQTARGMHGYFLYDENKPRYKAITLRDCEWYLLSKISSE